MAESFTFLSWHTLYERKLHISSHLLVHVGILYTEDSFTLIVDILLQREMFHIYLLAYFIRRKVSHLFTDLLYTENTFTLISFEEIGFCTDGHLAAHTINKTPK
jgi:hypothetical protein